MFAGICKWLDIYKNYQKNILEYSFLENSNNTISQKIKKELLEFSEDVLNSLKFHVDNLSSEIGIFFPVKKIIDIFDTKEYLFEINNYKYKKRNFSNFTISSDKYHGTTYNNEIAYFDPIILLNQFSQEFATVCKSFEDKEDIQLFMDQLNKIQFNAVILQQENLFNSIYSFRSKNRQMSLNELIKFFITQIDLNINNIDCQYIQYFNNKKKILLRMLNNQILPIKYKHISLEKLGFKKSKEKKDAEHIYRQLEFVLKRDLKFFYEKCVQDLITFLEEKCVSNKKNIQFSKKIVKYLISFDINANIKLGNSYNSKFQYFYKNKKYKINNLYKIFDFVNENKKRKQIAPNFESFIYLIDHKQFLLQNIEPFRIKL